MVISLKGQTPSQKPKPQYLGMKMKILSGHLNCQMLRFKKFSFTFCSFSGSVATDS